MQEGGERPVAAGAAAGCSLPSLSSFPVCLPGSLSPPLPGFGLGAGAGCPQVWGRHACSVFLLPCGSRSLKSAWPRPQADLVTADTQVIRAKGGADRGRRAVALSEGPGLGCVLLLPTLPYSTCAGESTEVAPEPRTRVHRAEATGRGIGPRRTSSHQEAPGLRALERGPD